MYRAVSHPGLEGGASSPESGVPGGHPGPKVLTTRDERGMFPLVRRSMVDVDAMLVRSKCNLVSLLLLLVGSSKFFLETKSVHLTF